MANELRHSDVGTALSKSEWEAVGGHIFNSQAAGDIMYASTTSQLSRLGIGSANQVLAVNSGATAPEWVTSVASATLATTVTVTDNEDTDEDNLITFVAGAASTTGAHGLEMDGNLNYNPSSGTLGATAYKVGADTLAEYIADTVGAMVGSNTETRIAVSYDDSDNTLDFVVDDMTANDNTTYSVSWVDDSADAILRLTPSTGSDDDLTIVAGSNITLTPSGDNLTIAAASAGTPTAITVADTTDTSSYVALFESATGDLEPKTDASITYNAGTGILTATGFAGALTGNVTGDVSGSSGSTTGNAATATKLAATKNIGGVAFDGSANIDLPGVNTAGNQSTSGNAATATALATARAINGTDFDGTAPITITAAGSTLSDTVTIAKGGTGATSASAGFDALSPMTTAGDIIYGGSSGAGTRLAKPGTPAGEVLTFATGATAPSWVAAGGGGGTTTMTVATGEVIYKGAPVGVDTNGKATPFTSTGGDWTGLTTYPMPAGSGGAPDYAYRGQIYYDTQTDIYVMVYSRGDIIMTNYKAAIYAVPFRVDADLNVVWGVEKEVAAEEMLYGNCYIEPIANNPQAGISSMGALNFVRGNGSGNASEFSMYFIKPVDGGGTGTSDTVNVSTRIDAGEGVNTTTYMCSVGDCSDGASDYRMVWGYQGESNYLYCRVVDQGTTGWDGSDGGAHNATVGSRYTVYSSSTYHPGVVQNMHQDKSSNSGTQVIYYCRVKIIGFDIGSSGTTINTIVANIDPPAYTRNKFAGVWAGVAGEAHFMFDGSGSYEYIHRVTINDSNEPVNYTTNQGMDSSPVNGSQNGEHIIGLEYYGTVDEFVALQSQYLWSSAGGLPGSTSFHYRKLAYEQYVVDDYSGQRKYGYRGDPATYTYDVGEDPMTVNYNHGAQNSGTMSRWGGNMAYNPDRGIITVMYAYSAWTADRKVNTFVDPVPSFGIWHIKVTPGAGNMSQRGSITPFIGFSAESGNVTGDGSATVEITVRGGVNENQGSNSNYAANQTALVEGEPYFMDDWGSIVPYGPTPIGDITILAGVAISATELVVDGGPAPVVYYIPY